MRGSGMAALGSAEGVSVLKCHTEPQGLGRGSFGAVSGPQWPEMSPSFLQEQNWGWASVGMQSFSRGASGLFHIASCSVLSCTLLQGKGSVPEPSATLGSLTAHSGSPAGTHCQGCAPRRVLGSLGPCVRESQCRLLEELCAGGTVWVFSWCFKVLQFMSICCYVAQRNSL